MTGTMMTAADPAEYGSETATDPDDRAEPPEFAFDPLLDSVYADVVAVSRGIGEIKRIADYLEGQLR
jgi:hypothetical protein